VPGSHDHIDWLRWLFYFIGGVPLIAWLFFTRDRVMRLIAVLTYLMLVQDDIVGRRYIVGGLSLAPSFVLAYIALTAEVLAQRRMPRFGLYLPLWMGFIFFAASGVMIGSIAIGTWGVNVKYFQINYVEGLVLFAYGMVALGSSREAARYSRYLMLLGFAVAVIHALTIATGFRFRNSIEEYADVYYAGTLDNANSLGSLYAMWIPVALSILVGRRQRPAWRFAILVSIVGMLTSLILTSSRGGLLFGTLTCILAFALSRVGTRRALLASGLAAGAAAVGYVVLVAVAPDQLREVIGLTEEQGTQTDRFFLFAHYTRMLFDHPLGIGTSPANFQARVAEYGIPGVVSAHNIYLDIALQAGIFGLAIFLGIIFGVLRANRRAAAGATDPVDREALVYLFLPLVGFLGAGFFEPIYGVSNKLNNLFWLSCGLSLGLSQKILDARRAARAAAEPEPFGVPAHLRPS
jgi:O-antigen ligase